MDVQRIESLIQKAESLPDDEARSCAIELMQSLLELHQSCLERLMEIVSQRGVAGEELFGAFAGDKAVSALLLLYGLHPLTLAERIDAALSDLRPQLNGSAVEVISINEGVVRLRVANNGHGCQASSVRAVINDAITEAAPDVSDLILDEVAPETKPVLVTLQRLPPAKAAVTG